MINPTAVFQRQKRLNRANYRETIYGQIFRNVGDGATASATQTFPGGAIILAIRANAVRPGQAAAAQTAKNRQLFAISFAVSTEGIVVGGPIMADVLLGGGDASEFPAQEIILPSNGTLLCTVQNLVTDALDIHVAYQALTPKI